jgi:hypothetical protein
VVELGIHAGDPYLHRRLQGLSVRPGLVRTHFSFQLRCLSQRGPFEGKWEVGAGLAGEVGFGILVSMEQDLLIFYIG